jgi:Icc-related predicted phosphoesterase
VGYNEPVGESLFVADLHGRIDRYRKLLEAIASLRPAAVFLGGDLLPHPLLAESPAGTDGAGFVGGFLAPEFSRLRESLAADYPRVFLILGNDDPRSEEAGILRAAGEGLWEYAHLRRIDWTPFTVYGCNFVPPTPFRLKDWERYDVSRHVDPGCYPPEEGLHTVPVAEEELRTRTIQIELADLTGTDDLDRAILLLHAPPYRSLLDRAALDGKMVDHVPLDVHVGSIAVRRLIEARRPRITLHGHVHESARLTGRWSEQIGGTWALSAAHDGEELALVRFDPERPEAARRELR